MMQNTLINFQADHSVLDEQLQKKESMESIQLDEEKNKTQTEAFTKELLADL